MKKGDTHDVHVEKNEIERFISDLQMMGPDTKVKGEQVYSDHVQLMSLSLPSFWVSPSTPPTCIGQEPLPCALNPPYLQVPVPYNPPGGLGIQLRGSSPVHLHGPVDPTSQSPFRNQMRGFLGPGGSASFFCFTRSWVGERRMSLTEHLELLKNLAY